MNRASVVTATLALALAAPLAAQQVFAPPAPPPGVSLGYRRTPLIGLDPFQHVIVPHWGLVFGAAADAANNTANFQDLGAFILLGRHDSITPTDVVNALSLVPAGQGLQGLAAGTGGVYVGGPLSGRLALGLSAQARAYGSFLVDDSAIALLRDGNQTRQNFSVGQTHGTGLATAEAGAHLLLRLGAIGDQAGPRVIVGAGARYVKPLAYIHSGGALNSGGIRLTGDSIDANVAVALDKTINPPSTRGSGIVTDYLVRLELPAQRLAIEAMLTGIGSVRIPQVEQELAQVNVATTDFRVVKDSIDNADFRVQDTAAVTVKLPRQARFAVNYWALPIVQLDAAYTTKVTGEFAAPAVLEAGATVRLLTWLPIRAGVVNEGDIGTGITGGVAIESRSFYFALSGASFGGAFKNAKGAGGRLELGFFF